MHVTAHRYSGFQWQHRSSQWREGAHLLDLTARWQVGGVAGKHLLGGVLMCMVRESMQRLLLDDVGVSWAELALLSINLRGVSMGVWLRDLYHTVVHQLHFLAFHNIAFHNDLPLQRHRSPIMPCRLVTGYHLQHLTISLKTLLSWPKHSTLGNVVDNGQEGRGSRFPIGV